MFVLPSHGSKLNIFHCLFEAGHNYSKPSVAKDIAGFHVLIVKMFRNDIMIWIWTVLLVLHGRGFSKKNNRNVENVPCEPFA